jgi:hypothetical protein
VNLITCLKSVISWLLQIQFITTICYGHHANYIDLKLLMALKPKLSAPQVEAWYAHQKNDLRSVKATGEDGWTREEVGVLRCPRDLLRFLCGPIAHYWDAREPLFWIEMLSLRTPCGLARLELHLRLALIAK